MPLEEGDASPSSPNGGAYRYDGGLDDSIDLGMRVVCFGIRPEEQRQVEDDPLVSLMRPPAAAVAPEAGNGDVWRCILLLSSHFVSLLVIMIVVRPVSPVAQRVGHALCSLRGTVCRCMRWSEPLINERFLFWGMCDSVVLSLSC